MRLHGASGTKQVWQPHVRTKGLSETNELYWRKYLRHCWDFSAPPAVIRRPGTCGSPSLRPCGHPLAAFIDLVQAIKDNRRRWCEWRVGRRVGCSMYHTKRTCGQNVQLRSALFSSLFCFSTSLVLAAIDFVCVCRDSFASLILYEHVRDADEKLKKCFPLI